MNTSSSRSLSRRNLIARAGAAFAGALLPGADRLRAATSAAPAAPGKPAPPPIEPLNRFPRMVHEHFVSRVRAIETHGNAVRAALHNKRDAQAYVRDVRGKIQRCFGPWPEKTPLNPRVTGVVERDAYRIEKVIFESRPGFLVTANLYIPRGGKSPLPGVVGTCGHSANGKAAEAYQSFAQGLARQGYVTLIFDPIGQGERAQYVDANLKPTFGPGVATHLRCGNQQFLVGEFLGAWRAWDGIRALDYLLTRPEVDPRRVGVTGNSGGGTMTTWLAGVEPRWSMAAPSCFVTTFLHNLENELPADTEQCPPRALALGLDHADFLAALAPKPVIILAKEKDFFDVRGSEEAFARLKRLYALLGAEEDIALFTGPTDHGYTQENREAMYRWFNRVTGASDAQAEPALTIEKDETLWCTPRGHVAELKSRTVFSFTREKAEALSAARGNVRGAALAGAVRDVLKLPDPGAPPAYRILRPLARRRHPKKSTGVFAVETDPGIHAVVYLPSDEQPLSRPRAGGGRAILYVAHRSADAELREEPLVAELAAAEPGAPLYACDVRGTGESQPVTCGQDSFLEPYGCDFFYAIHAIMLDRPYVGQKIRDVLRVIDWLKSCGHTEIHIAASGWGALPATFAALLHDAVAQVTLKNALASFDAVARSEQYAWPLATLPPGILERFDLPDCYRALEAKKLRQIEPWGAMAAAV